MGTLEYIFVVCAALGGALFLIRLILIFMGGDSEGADGDVDVGGDVEAGGDTDSDVSFSMLSLQGMSAMLLMFGLVGLLVHKAGGPAYLAIPLGLVSGVVMVWAMAKLIGSMMKLQSSGTIVMTNAVGAEGTVYLRIPAEGSGQVQITIQNRLMIFDAISEAKAELASGTPVKVERLVGGKTLSVKKL